MALGPSLYLVNAWLDATFNSTAFNVTGDVWIQLHLGDPGAAGTANPATETSRQQASMAVAAGGAVANDADVTWDPITGSEDATHFSIWDASTAGNFLGSGVITANAYTAGDAYTCPAGSLNVDMSAALAA